MKTKFSYRLAGLLACALFFLNSCQNDPNTYAEIETPFGKMKVVLYESTPEHKANFIKLATEGYYEDLLWHRAIPDFMAQGGDPNSRNAKPGVKLGFGNPGYTIPAEIGAPHLRGALCAASVGGPSNPDKRSSGSQFYIVQGKKFTLKEIEGIEKSRGIKYNEIQKELYQTKGGYPYIDNDYTVFGEVVDGIEVIDQITTQPRDANNRPNEDIWMKVKILE